MPATSDQAAATTSEQVFAVVRDAVARVLELDPDTLRPQTSFEELRADSLALVEIVEIVEEALVVGHPGFRIDDDDIDGLHTLGEATDYAVARL